MTTGASRGAQCRKMHNKAVRWARSSGQKGERGLAGEGAHHEEHVHGHITLPCGDVVAGADVAPYGELDRHDAHAVDQQQRRKELDPCPNRLSTRPLRRGRKGLVGGVCVS